MIDDCRLIQFFRRSAAVAALLLVLVAASSAEEARRHDFARAGQYQVLTGDFHMHTVNSDGKMTARERVLESYLLGYDVIAITDHRNMRAHRAAKQIGEPLGMVVLRGMETGVAEKEHMNAIGIDDAYNPRDSHKWAEKPGGKTVFYQDELRAIAEHGGIVIYNHPHVGFREPVKWGVAQGTIQGIEVKNEVVGGGWSTADFQGSKCYPSAFDFALENHIAMFANTDAHGPRGKNPPVTLLLVTEKSPKGVIDAIRAGRTIAWFDGMVWGRKDMLSQLIEAVVVPTRSAGSDGKTSLALANTSPIRFAGMMGDRQIDLPPYGTVSLDTAPSTEPIRVMWSNVWASPRENVATVFTTTVSEAAR